MMHIRIEEGFETCRQIWENIRPVETLFDLWPVRVCFATSFDRNPYFVIAEEGGKIVGLLPLSRTDEPESFGFFPGELWSGKTWLERNRIIARDARIAHALLNHVPGTAHLRYMAPCPLVSEVQEMDEIGYLFLPADYQYQFDTYMAQFSAKSRKKLSREIDAVTAPGVAFRYDVFADVDHFFRMNLGAFGERSYFSDPRFLKSFEKLIAWLAANEMLRITTVLIGGRIAAVDVGAVLGTSYTVLAGGTDPEFPGIAKRINFHHMEWACRLRMAEVDFLCGDFGWKERFHLTPRPLYQIRIPAMHDTVRLPAHPIPARVPFVQHPARMPAPVTSCGTHPPTDAPARNAEGVW
ncbi:GNAT family N-acetyltransferase [Desulfococcus sp.]|uniref:GNAT family N-acetyltransferase n=1 Tax=Desulfococcus sp. TaxID=2025834 RepID=UPI003592F1E5